MSRATSLTQFDAVKAVNRVRAFRRRDDHNDSFLQASSSKLLGLHDSEFAAAPRLDGRELLGPRLFSQVAPSAFATFVCGCDSPIAASMHSAWNAPKLPAAAPSVELAERFVNRTQSEKRSRRPFTAANERPSVCRKVARQLDKLLTAGSLASACTQPGVCAVQGSCGQTAYALIGHSPAAARRAAATAATFCFLRVCVRAT